MDTAISVAERVERDVLARLQTINVANKPSGITTYFSPITLTAVRRRGFPAGLNDSEQVWMQRGETGYEHRSAAQLDEIMRLVLIYGVNPNTDHPATALNAARFAIRAALQTDGQLFIPYTVPAGGTGATRAILIMFVSDAILFPEAIRPPLLLGAYAIDATYSSMKRDPTLWDTGDKLVTE